MSEAINGSGGARRYVVHRVIGFADGGVAKVPLRAFDVQADAEAWAEADSENIQAIPQQLMQRVMVLLGIAKAGTVVTPIATPDGERRIALATSMPTGRMA